MTRYVRIKRQKELLWGILTGDSISVLDKAPWQEPVEIGQIVRFSEQILAAPVEPSKIVLVGLNYQEHVRESQSASDVPEEPVIFMKPPTAIIGPGEEIPCYAFLERVDYEAELAAVMGARIFQANEDEARQAIFGYTCLNDVTARLLQKKDVQWTRAKGFDGFCPIGPWIVSGIDPTDLEIETSVNGIGKQLAKTSDQIWDIFELVSFISNVMTLLPGDVVSTGTPSGVGPIKPGDVVKVTIEKIGTLENKVKAA
jgi:2-keto-4-pentenoate hydratase/2-oxohepta-3-ene-1,7-dioic acid hydratase in catechol pathway